MLAKTQEETFSGYSGSLRTYSIRQVPDMSSGPEGGMSETFGSVWEILELKDLYIGTLYLYIQIHTA